MAIIQQQIIPAVHFNEPMEELSFQPEIISRDCAIRHVLSNSFGFGGNNTSIIFSKVEE
jgi:3-oxoacyl-[acyl-carrier-protein] synthase-1